MSSFIALDDLEAGFSGGATPISGGRRTGSYRAMSLSFSSGAAGGHFLDSCSLCNKALRGNRDIFMYRGDSPFCSEECRQVQIDADEAEEKRRSNPSAGKKGFSLLAMKKQQQVHVRAADTLVAG